MQFGKSNCFLDVDATSEIEEARSFDASKIKGLMLDFKKKLIESQ